MPKRDLIVAVISAAVILGTAFISANFLGRELLQADSLGPYFRLGFKTAWIALCYYLYLSQIKAYPLFQYYRQRNAELRVGN